MMGLMMPTLSPVIGWDQIGSLADATNPAGRSPHAVEMNGKFYVVWCGTPIGSLTAAKIYVSEYDPVTSTWTRIDAGSGINIYGLGQMPFLHVFSGKLYCAYHETVGGGSLYFIRVSVWSGSGTVWTNVDAVAGSGLNKSSSRTGTIPTLVTLNSKLYCSWTESARSGGNTDYQVRCAVYNGNDSSPSWAFVDGDAATGLNKSTTEHAWQSVSIEFSGKLYLFWAEENASSVRQLRCRVYNGNDSAPAWTFVDGNGTNGINFNTSNTVGDGNTLLERAISPFVFNGKLYVAWHEGSPKAVRMKVYNGNDSSPVWTTVDGGSATGLAFDTTKSSQRVSACVPVGMYPHLIWGQGFDTVLRAAVYNGVDSSPVRRDIDTASELSGVFGAYTALTPFQDGMCAVDLASVGRTITVYRARL